MAKKISTGMGIALGVLAAGVLGTGLYFATKPKTAAAASTARTANAKDNYGLVVSATPGTFSTSSVSAYNAALQAVGLTNAATSVSADGSTLTGTFTQAPNYGGMVVQQAVQTALNNSAVQMGSVTITDTGVAVQ
jgi:hypothetical protein